MVVDAVDVPVVAGTGSNDTSVAYFAYAVAAAPATTVPTVMDLGTSYRLTTMVRGSQIDCSIGDAKISATGEVFNLVEATDLNGTFIGGEAGITVIGGAPLLL